MAKSLALALTGLISLLSIAGLALGASLPSDQGHTSTVQIRIVEHSADTQHTTHDVQHSASHSQFAHPHRVETHADQLYLPVVDQPDIREDDKQLLHDVLMWLPAACRENLEQLIVRYDPTAPRGQATKSTILLRGGMNREETIAILVHECGHIVDLGGITGTQFAEASMFPDGPIATYEDDPSVQFYQISWENVLRHHGHTHEADFASGYASEDPFEDFAEAFILYALHHDLFMQMAQENNALAQKYAFMRSRVFGPYFQTYSSHSVTESDERVWDITKLAHAL